MGVTGMTRAAEAWAAKGVAVLMPADSSAEVAVILQVEDAPAGIVLEIFGSEQLYVRMRNGALVFGLVEPYRQRESSSRLERGPAVLTTDDHYVARFADSTTLFGAQDTVVVMPYDESGRPHPLVSIPMASLQRPRRAVFRLDENGGADERVYTLVGESELDEGYTCPVCGKYCEKPEPHTSAHGVPGHYSAGARPGRVEDDVRSQPYAV